jgi:tetratricopeptide (TPR) repeat protein
MSYNKTYNTSKPLKTKFYSAEELENIRGLIKKFFDEKHPEATLNSNESNYIQLVDAINNAYSENILTTRFVCDIYNQNCNTQRKNIKKISSLADYIHGLFVQGNQETRNKIPEEIKKIATEAWENRNNAFYDKAIEQLQFGLNKASETKDEFSTAYLGFYFAIILDEKYHKTDEAVQMMLDCIEIFQKYGDIKETIDAYSSLSGFEVHRGNLFQAKSYATKAFQLTQNNSSFSKNHFIHLAERHNKLGWVEHQLGNYKVAIEEYNTGLSLLISEEVKNDVTDEKLRKNLIAISHHHLGLSYQRLNDVFNAKGAFSKAVNAYREINFKLDLAKVLYELAHVHFHEAEYKDGDTCLNEAMFIYYEIKDYVECVKCLDLKGRLKYTLGQKEEAYDIFIECCNMLELHPVDLKLLEDMYHKIGDINLKKNDFEKASEYYNKSKELSEQNNHPFGIADALRGLAQIEKKKGNKEEYKNLLVEAISVLSNSLSKIESDERKAYLIGTIGHYHELLGNHHEALQYLSKAKTIYEQKQSISGIARCLGEMARIYHLQKRGNEAFNTLRAMKKIVDGSTNYELIAGSAISLGNYQLELGNHQEAKVLFQEAEFLNKKYNLHFTKEVKKLSNEIYDTEEINQPSEISFEELLNDLFEFISQFPEAKDGIFRMWFYCRKQELFSNIKSLHGIKLMICEDDISLFSNCAKKFHYLTDISLQVVNDDFPDAAMEFVPFPHDKKFYPNMAVPTGKYVNGVLHFNMNGALESRYTVCAGDIVTSELTGKKGSPVMGWSTGLPPQAHNLILNSNAKKLLREKVFFFPHERHKANDKLLSDLHIAKEYEFLPVYISELPYSKFVNLVEFYDFKMPLLSGTEVTKIVRPLRKLKTSLKKILNANKTTWRETLDELKIEIDEINQEVSSKSFLNLRISLLEYQGLIEKENFSVLILK